MAAMAENNPGLDISSGGDEATETEVVPALKKEWTFLGLTKRLSTLNESVSVAKVASFANLTSLKQDPTGRPAGTTAVYLGESDYGDFAKRDVRGYGPQAPNPGWPKGARVALNFVINYEEGGESCLLHGDAKSEHLLSEIVGATPIANARNVNMESLYDYGSRAGFWRLHRLFVRKKCAATVYAVGMALERNPDAARAMAEAGWEVASHGYRWIDYQDVDEDTERSHIARTVAVHEKLLGHRPLGLYQGKPNSKTRRLCVEHGGFLYDSDSYADDLPYWNTEYGRPHLIIPYTLSENDMRFASPNGFSTGDDFFTYLKNYLDFLLEEVAAGAAPKMMTVGLHCRIVGRPGRAMGLAKFIDYAQTFGDDVWITRRDHIARHWYQNHWPAGHGQPPQWPQPN